MAHETIECDLQNKSEDFIDIPASKSGGGAKVPVLEIDGETLVESSVTVEYLAEREWRALLPRQRRKAGLARLMAEIQALPELLRVHQGEGRQGALAEKVAEFEEAVENFETFLEDPPGRLGRPLPLRRRHVLRRSNNGSVRGARYTEPQALLRRRRLEICPPPPTREPPHHAILERPSVKETSALRRENRGGMTRMMKMFASK